MNSCLLKPSTSETDILPLNGVSSLALSVLFTLIVDGSSLFSISIETGTSISWLSSSVTIIENSSFPKKFSLGMYLHSPVFLSILAIPYFPLVIE